METLESADMRPRQVRYQAALRPDICWLIHSKILSSFLQTPIHYFRFSFGQTLSKLSKFHPPGQHLSLYPWTRVEEGTDVRWIVES